MLGSATYRQTRRWSSFPVIMAATGLFAAFDSLVLLRHGLRDWPRPWLHILGEQNTVTWVSSMQLALCGWLALVIGLLLQWQVVAKRRWRQAGWLLAGLAFLFLAADEALEFHEHITLPLTLPGQLSGEGFLLLFGLSVGGAVSWLLLPMLWRVPSVLGGCLLACAIGFASQLIDGRAVHGTYFALKMAEVGEEALELLAEATFIGSLAGMVRSQVEAIIWRLARQKGGEASSR